MSAAPEDTAGPRPLIQALIGAGLLALSVALAFDATRLPPPNVNGVGPSAALRLVAALLALLGLVHLGAAWRRRALHVAVARGNLRSLAWVMAALVGLMLVLEVGGGFVLGSAWLFIATARGFGERIRPLSVSIGVALSAIVFLFFTRALSLALPTGPLERLLLG